MPKKKKITIEGIVIPETWSDTGEISTLSIVTYTEKKYLIAKDKNAEKLKSLLRKRVIAKGVIQKIDNQENLVLEQFELDDHKPDISVPPAFE